MSGEDRAFVFADPESTVSKTSRGQEIELASPVYFRTMALNTLVVENGNCNLEGTLRPRLQLATHCAPTLAGQQNPGRNHARADNGSGVDDGRSGL